MTNTFGSVYNIISRAGPHSPLPAVENGLLRHSLCALSSCLTVATHGPHRLTATTGVPLLMSSAPAPNPTPAPSATTPEPSDRGTSPRTPPSPDARTTRHISKDGTPARRSSVPSPPPPSHHPHAPGCDGRTHPAHSWRGDNLAPPNATHAPHGSNHDGSGDYGSSPPNPGAADTNPAN